MIHAMSPLTWYEPPLDPWIWRNLPLEVLCTVIESCDRRTLVNWSCTSQFFYTLASNELWNTLSIGPEDLLSFHDRPYVTWKYEKQHSMKELRRKDHMIVHFLTGHAFRQRSTRRTVALPMIGDQTPKLPTARVKDLRLDFNQHHLAFSSARGVFHEASITGLAKSILPLLLNLRTCYFEGPLCMETWDLLMKVRDLRSLTIRAEADYVLPCGVRWASSQILNLQQLAGLIHLTSLSVGRLSPNEAQGLAYAVVSLKLSTLSTCAGPPARNDRDSRSVFAGNSTHSPILTFLQAVLRASSLLASGVSAVSQTLRTVVLKDLYRRQEHQGRSIDHELLADTLQLWQLTDLDICVMHPDILRSFFLHVELPALKHFATAGCRHLFSDEDWSQLGIHIPEHNLEESSLVSFEPFLRRHQQTIASMTIYRTSFEPPLYRNNALRFCRQQLYRFSTPDSTLDSAMVNARRWQGGHWMFCRNTNSYCCARNERLRVSITTLEAMRELRNIAHS